MTCSKPVTRDAFRVGIHDAAREFRLKLEGRLGAAESREVEQCWRTAASTIGGRRFVVDLSGVTSVDASATELLGRLRENGAELERTAAGQPFRWSRIHTALCRLLAAFRDAAR